ncbi:Co2+/Mg2+ efflux protein ApaG [Epilithonimonas hispanica]|uniref:Co2+/Mg2+ efflux protein ApaG n=2 Tax=Epilithonimonas hispanica TaxID=358687 RepID=A0A3D9CPI9_9FLAO|nr:Co2+/Mg2+ efflux protein ApaG [Epilithonimonas hispanica]
MMVSKITSEIKVSVTTDYDNHNSYPSENRYVFRYNIEIENLSNVAVRLLSRKWMIYDLGFGFTEVEGAGVIGLTPVIESGEKFNYFSNVIVKSGVGNMEGSYLFENANHETFDVSIPKFNLVSEVLSN